ncbi:hypothetical protein ABZP36_034620 [Zizania latifolia]
MPAIPTAPSTAPNPNVLLTHSRQGLLRFPSSSSSSSSSPFSNRLRLARRRAASMSTEAQVPVAPPAHPTYDLKAVIDLALSEDAGDRGTYKCAALAHHSPPNSNWASGNVTIDTVKKIGETGVTYISSGALTHSVKALDISLKIDTELALQVGRRTNRA